MTVRLYARRKSWPLRSITVGLAHGKIGAEDCASCHTTTGQVDHIRRDLILDGDLNSDQRAKLAVIADKCPVHRMLQSEVVVDTVIHQPVRVSA
jgi:putative redox protein